MPYLRGSYANLLLTKFASRSRLLHFTRQVAEEPASTLKSPSSSSASVCKPSKLHLKHAGAARIFIAGETHLNKKKHHILSKYGCPQRDQICLWGAVLQGHVRTHFIFGILKNAEDAHDGKPRGHQEMLTNFSMLGMRNGDIFVSNKWKAALSALEAHRNLHMVSAPRNRV